MPDIKPTPEEIRRGLLASAKKLFFANGIAGTEMKMIAADAGFSRSTLYRYMLDRNQMAFMVSTEVLQELTDKCMSASIAPSLTGYEKLCKYAFHNIQALCDNVALVNYLNEFDVLFKDEYPASPEALEYSRTMNRNLHRIAQFMFEGLSDGSIRPVKEPMQFVVILINTIVGLAERMLPREAHYLEEHGASAKDTIIGATTILLESVRGDTADIR